MTFCSRAGTDAGLEREERSVVREFRWWSVDDLDGTDEAFVPSVLPHLLREATNGAATADGPRKIQLQ